MSTPESRGTARLARVAREQMALVERTRPLLRPILTAMYNARSASVTMAEILEHVGWADLPAIREEIGHLERSWLISGQGEGATRRFRLTQSGEVQLSNHRAHGAQEPPPRSPTREQRVAYLSSAFTDAVEMIDAGETDDATARLSIVAQQAHKYGAHSLGLRAQIGLKRAGGVGQPGLN